MKVKIKGGRETEAALRALGKQVTARAVGRRGLKLAAEPIQALARALAPDDPKTGPGKFLKDSIKVGNAKSRDKDQIWIKVGIDASADPARYVNRVRGGGSYRDPGVAGAAVIMEFGAPGANVPAHPFMRPAWEANKAASPQRIADSVRVEVRKAAERQARKAARASA
jgi:hypothetical protein